MDNRLIIGMDIPENMKLKMLRMRDFQQVDDGVRAFVRRKLPIIATPRGRPSSGAQDFGVTGNVVSGEGTS